MIAIHPLTSADAEDYRSIRLAALRDSPAAFGSTLGEESGRPISHFERRLATSTILAAYKDSRIVGTARFTAESGLKDRHKGLLGGMYVEPPERRRGVGDAIVRAVIAHATGVVEQLLLSVVRGNASAIALYDRHGFSAYGVEPRSLKDGSDYRDEILMIKFLGTHLR